MLHRMVHVKKRAVQLKEDKLCRRWLHDDFLAARWTGSLTEQIKEILVQMQMQKGFC